MGLLNMSKKSDESGNCDVTRIGFRLPGIPIPTEGVLRRKVSGLNLPELQSNSIQTPLVSFQQAAKETLLLLKAYKADINQDVRVVEELLQLNPYFVRFQWVADAAERLQRCQRAKRKRGRARWRYQLNPEVVVGLVQLLRASGEAKSDRDAANWLEISGIFSSTKALRKLKQARKDPRLKPLLSHPPSSWPDYTEEELKRMYETAITPEENQTLRFTLQGNQYQFVRVIKNADTSCADKNNS